MELAQFLEAAEAAEVELAQFLEAAEAAEVELAQFLEAAEVELAQFLEAAEAAEVELACLQLLSSLGGLCICWAAIECVDQGTLRHVLNCLFFNAGGLVQQLA